MIALILACVEPDSEAKEDVPPLEEGFVGPGGRRLTGAYKTWLDGAGLLHTLSEDNPPPDGQFHEVSGQGVQCARDDVSVQCWGGNEYGEAEGAQGNFVQEWLSA